MTTLTLSTGSFDQLHTFTILVQGARKMRTITASLHQGYQSKNDGIYWALQGAVCMKQEYTEQDLAETNRLNSLIPIKHKDIVTINNEYYKVKVLGNFSDCAIFEKI